MTKNKYFTVYQQLEKDFMQGLWSAITNSKLDFWRLVKKKYHCAICVEELMNVSIFKDQELRVPLRRYRSEILSTKSNEELVKVHDKWEQFLTESSNEEMKEDILKHFQNMKKVKAEA